MWKVSRESSITLLGGRAASLLQIAHPLVAAGVADHSDYRTDPYGRLRRTLDAMFTIVFEPEDEARETVARIEHIHSFVKGVSPDGVPYSALDPHLKMWVHATLIYTSVKVYRRFVAPLSDDEIESYYSESRIVADLFSIPTDLQPESFEALRAWMRERVETGEVYVTDQARELAEPILRPLRIVPSAVSRLSVITASLLPRPIREGYGLRVDAPRAALFAVGGRASRLLLPLVPGPLRSHPNARYAARRSA